MKQTYCVTNFPSLQFPWLLVAGNIFKFGVIYTAFGVLVN